MKKFLNIVLALAIVGVLAAPLSTKAINSTSSAQELLTLLQEQIASLRAKIQSLTTQLESLQQAKGEIKEEAKEVKNTIQLIKQLRRGMTGDDVTLLQEFLATDSDIYPEGLITGYFGPMTQRAVKRLQKRLCLDQVGQVGPQTLRRINELLSEGAGNSGKVPSGLLKAPGIQKKLCGTNPATTTPATTTPATTTPATTTPATTTPDIAAPTITDVMATSVTATTVQILWTTDEEADSKIWYGTDDPVVMATPTAMIASDADVLSHAIDLTGLTASTTYYYVVISADAADNVATSAQQSFVTAEE